MNIDLESGVYVVAVSGGVDSVVLLHALSKLPGITVIVGHVDHGIRQDSATDLQFVQLLASRYGFTFESTSLVLGPGASENNARKARYEFLDKVRKKYQARAILTAHHQDDVIETMILNLLRGTSRKGLSSLRSSKTLLRPFLGHAKSELVSYAQDNNLDWHEDSTNTDQRYLRNLVRHSIVPQMDDNMRSEWVGLYAKMTELNDIIDQEITNLMQFDAKINRTYFCSLPFNIQREIVAVWLNTNQIEPTKRLITDLAIFCKTAKPGSVMDLPGGFRVSSNAKAVVVTTRQNV